MKAKITIAAPFLCIICHGLFAQPLVYNVENTGVSCTPPPLPRLVSYLLYNRCLILFCGLTVMAVPPAFCLIWGRLANTYYIDDASVKEVGTGGGSWQWVQLINATPSVGTHTLTFGYRDGNAKLDKVLVTTFSNVITGKGETATNCATVCNTALGNRLYVDTSATGGGNGATWGCAFKQLAHAVKYANSDPSITEIWVARGVYTNGVDRNTTMLLSRANLQILGGFNGTETPASQANPVLNPTIISGDIGTIGNNNDNTRLLLFISSVPTNTSRLIIDGFTFADANSDNGCAIQASYSNSSTPILLSHCIFRNNTASGSGGAVTMDNSTIRFYSCRFTNNRANIGGAVFSFQSTLSVFFSCVFAGNTASNAGGAYYGNNGLVRFIHCALNGNTAAYGGSVYQNRLEVEYYNTVFSNNTAAESGGAIYQHSRSNSLILNTTFYNSAARSGGAIILGFDNCFIHLWNSVMFNNTSNGLNNAFSADILSTEGTAYDIKNTSLQAGTQVPADNGTTIMGNIRGGVNPQFASQANAVGADGVWFTADDGLRISKLSPFINAGNNSLTPIGTDITTAPPVACAITDLGAYEVQDCLPVAEFVKAETSAIAGAVANPFTNDLQIRYTGDEKAGIRVTAIAGNAMAVTTTAPKGITHVNTANWARGIYQVEVMTASGKKINFKVVKL